MLEEVEKLEAHEHNPGTGKYRYVLRLDSGGMAEVFLAVAQGPAGFNKLFVLKRLREALADNQEHRDMFLHEARLSARLNHPNVVQTYEVGEDDSGIFIAMEYLEGQPLSRLRRAIGKAGVDVAAAVHARIASEVLCGLHYAHEATDYDGTPLRIVHRDVSPQNVFVTYDGQVKLVDFGIAKTYDSGTQAGIFKGKFAYTAPEQLRGEAIDRRADVFAAGIVLWEMLTGERLLASDNPAKTLARLLHEPIPTVASLMPEIDPRLDAIVGKALQRNPDDRYPTAQAMRDALEEFLVASSQSVRQDEIARLLGELFRAERTRVRKAIKDELIAVQGTSCSRVVTAPRLAATDESVASAAIANLALARPAPTNSAFASGINDGSPAIEPTRRSGVTPFRVGLVTLILGIGGVLAYPSIVGRPPAPPPPPQQLEVPAAKAAEPTASPAQPLATPSSQVVAGPSSVTTEAIDSATGKAVHPSPKYYVHKPAAPVASSALVPPPAPVAASTAPSPPPATEASGQKEKRKFRIDL